MVSKPSGVRCAELLNGLKRRLGAGSAGYAGTLDAFASGLLVTAFGRATRLLKYVMALDKTYEAVVRLGRTTETLDPTGPVSAEGPVPSDRSVVEAAVARFVGTYDQVPPAYSSKKVEGRRASDLVRAGRVPSLRPSRVTVYAAEVLSWDPSGLLGLRVRCSSGTYIRSLARDLAAALGTVGMVEVLVRTANGPYRLEDAVGPDAEGLEGRVVPMAECLPFLPVVELRPQALRRVANGGGFRDADCVSAELQNGPCRVIFDRSLVAVAERRDGVFRILDGFGNGR